MALAVMGSEIILLGALAYGGGSQSPNPTVVPPGQIAAGSNDPAPVNADLQAILDRGQNLLLEPRKVYSIKKALNFKVPGQKVSTAGAIQISDYAVLRIAGEKCSQLVNGDGINGVILERVILDGNRYGLSVLTGEEGGGPELVHFGGVNVKDQVVRNCVLMNTRCWSTLKVQEGCIHVTVESNLILGAGTDPRGNGRDMREKPWSCSDGISCAGRETVIRDNLILDPTDGAIVLFGAPGTVAEDNVIACISRESLGAVNMVDPIAFYAIDGDKTRTDYRGTTVRNNLIDAFGARVHIAIAMGGPPWAPKNRGLILVGATVTGNIISGGAAGYGLVVSGVDGFTVTGNISTASYSGVGMGEAPVAPADEPGPFLFDPKAIGNSVLQPDFRATRRELLHLLRANREPNNSLGFRAYPYGEAEVKAVARAAYLEMLRREPTAPESAYATRWLQESKGNADGLRRYLMMTPEFTNRFGFVIPEDLQLYRTKLWMGMFDTIRRERFAKDGKFPTAKELYREAMGRLPQTNLRRSSRN